MPQAQKKDLNQVREFFTNLKTQFASAATIYEGPIKALFEEVRGKLESALAGLPKDSEGDWDMQCTLDTVVNCMAGCSSLLTQLGLELSKHKQMASAAVLADGHIPTQTLLTTYAGTVTTTGPTPDAAYAVALARAQQLGANKEGKIDSTAFLLRSEITFEQRQVTQDSAVEMVRLTFSYEYQSKLGANRTYLEMTSTVNRETFGVDVETCSGFVAARDAATAQAVYQAQIRELYDGRLIQSEQTGVVQSQNQSQVQSVSTGAGQQWSPTGGGPAASSAFNTQHLKFEFHLQVFTPKLTGEVGVKYAVEVTRDFLTLEMHTAVSGSCSALDRPTADTAVTALLKALAFGASVRSRRVEDRQTEGTTDVMLKLDFEEEFIGRVVGQAGVNDMKLTERVVYSGTRWAVQNVPFAVDGSGGVSIPQPSGIEPGSRTVTGSVTAATLATAQTWAMAQRALLTGDAQGNHFVQPEQWETDYEFVPRIDGVAKGTGENVRLFRVNFTFTEILPLYPAPTVTANE